MFPYQNTVYPLAISQPPFASHHKLVIQKLVLLTELLQLWKKKKKVSYTRSTLPPAPGYENKQHWKKHLSELNRQTELKLTQECNFTDL